VAEQVAAAFMELELTGRIEGHAPQVRVSASVGDSDTVRDESFTLTLNASVGGTIDRPAAAPLTGARRRGECLGEPPLSRPIEIIVSHG
jgi:hypothetical protein